MTGLTCRRLQGIIQIGLLFNQIAPITLSFAVISLLEAATRSASCLLFLGSAVSDVACGLTRSVAVCTGGQACCSLSALVWSSSPSSERCRWASCSPSALLCFHDSAGLHGMLLYVIGVAYKSGWKGQSLATPHKVQIMSKQS